MAAPPRIAQNTLALLGSNLGARLIGLATVMLLTRRLGVEAYGHLSLAYAYWGLAALVCEAGSDVLLVREASRGARPLAHLLANGMLLRAALTLVVYSIALAALPWQGYADETEELARLALLMLACSPLTAARVVFMVSQQIRRLAALDMAAQLLGAAAVVWAMALGGQAATVLWAQLGATALAQACYLAAAWRALPSPRAFRLDGALWLLLAAMGWPLLLSGLLNQSLAHLSRMVTGSLLRPEEVGLFAVASNLTTTLLLLPTIYFTSTYPLLAQSFAADRAAFQHLARQSNRLMMLIAIPLATLLSVTSAGVVTLYAGPAFAGAAPLLATMAWTLVPGFAGVTLYHLILATGQEWLLPRVGLALATTQVGLLLLLLPRAGLIGTAVAPLTMYAVSFTIYSTLPGTRPFVAEWLRACLRPALAALPVAGAILALRPPLLVAWAGGAATYGLLILLTDETHGALRAALGTGWARLHAVAWRDDSGAT